MGLGSYNQRMKLLAGVLVVLGVGLLLFRAEVVDFVPNFNALTAPITEKVKPKLINIIFVGDIMLGRAVENRYSEGDIFKNVSGIFKEADAVVANLEGPILSNHIKTPYNSFKFSFATTTLDILKNSGFTDLSLANNHTDNYGRDGFMETLLNLKSAGLYSFGDPNIISDYSFVEREIGRNKFIFAGINDTYGNLTKESILEFAGDLRSKFPDDFLIFVMHWGEEYKFIANSRQEELGRGLIDSGADMVIGSHPHVIQNIEKYNNKFIFYSLGNFVFDQYFSTSTQEGLAIRFQSGEGVSRLELLPATLYGSSPKFLDGMEKATWLKKYSEKNHALELMISVGVLE